MVSTIRFCIFSLVYSQAHILLLSLSRNLLLPPLAIRTTSELLLHLHETTRRTSTLLVLHPPNMTTSLEMTRTLSREAILTETIALHCESASDQKLPGLLVSLFWSNINATSLFDLYIHASSLCVAKHPPVKLLDDLLKLLPQSTRTQFSVSSVCPFALVSETSRMSLWDMVMWRRLLLFMTKG